LLTLAADPKAIEFYRDLADPAISLRPRETYTPVQAARREIELLRDKKKSARDRYAQEALCAFILGAVELWQKGPSAPGYFSDGNVPPVRIVDRVRAVHALKAIPGDYFATA
jgi:hypothetical protein